VNFEGRFECRFEPSEGLDHKRDCATFELSDQLLRKKNLENKITTNPRQDRRGLFTI
tara:strand:+ start:467 stop:637 length:171 start_codon:yes stop_codon:yes gene_type:complete